MANKAQQASVTLLDDASNVSVKSGDNKFGLDQAGFIWGSGISAEEYSELLSYLYPQYLATAMIDKLSSEATSNQRFFWAEQDRTRKALEISVAPGAPGATVTVTVTADSAAYVIKGDTYRTRDGKVVVVDNVVNDQVTISILDTVGYGTISGQIEVSDVSAGSKLGHIGSNFAEGSSNIGSRTSFPNQRNNQTNILRKN